MTTIRSELPPIDPIQSEAFASFDHNFVDSELVFEPTTTAELSVNVAKLSMKSSLLDPLPSSLLMKCLLGILPVIKTIVNIYLETSSVLLCLKKSVVTPLLKKPQLDHEIISNFRPVSKLSFLSKVMEKVFAIRLKSHLFKTHLNELASGLWRRSHHPVRLS